MLTDVNPWTKLKLSIRQRYVLPEDAPIIDDFNQRVRGTEYELRLEIPPTPFIGRKDAPILLLNLNPGFDARDTTQRRQYFRRICEMSYRHARMPYPFYFLDPKIEGDADGPGRKWWRDRVFANVLDLEDEVLSRSFLCVEFFPYHSKKFRALRDRLPSQQYGFDLVSAAMKRQAMIIVMRSWRRWIDAVPGLESYRHTVRLRSPRYPRLSERNMGIAEFRLLRRTIQKAAA